MKFEIISSDDEKRKLSFATIQKMYLSDQNITKLGLKVSKYCMVQCLNSQYVCKVYNKEISNDTCLIDSTVEVCNNQQVFDESIKSVQVCPIVSVKVDLIFNSISKCLKWQKEIMFVKDLLKKNILKTFCFPSHCKINLLSSKYHEIFGLNEIIVHTVSYTTNFNFEKNLVIGKITNNSVINITNFYSVTEYQHILKPKKIQIFGFENEYKHLEELLSINKYITLSKQRNIKIPKQILLVGPCGLGKKALVYAVATRKKIPIVTVVGSELFKQESGESEKYLRETFKSAEQITNNGSFCILLIEDLENITPKLTVNTGIHIARISSQFLKLLDEANLNQKLIIIATTSNSTSLHSGIRRHGRIDSELHLKLPTESTRFEILNYWCNILFDKICNNKVVADVCKSIAQITQGYTSSDLKLLCRKVLFQINKEKKNLQEKCKLEKVFKSIVYKSYPTSIQTFYSKTLSQNKSDIKNIGGYEKIISLLYQSIEWPIRNPELFKRMGITPSRGLLMYGPPGCAKTSLACAIAKELNFSFFTLSAAQLYSPYVGVAESTLTTVFQQARQNAPSIVFIDEIDAIFGNRSNDNHNEVQNRLLSALLIEMDGIVNNIGQKTSQGDYNLGVFIISATNRPLALDSALMRPGRFDKIVYVPLPDEVSRLDILKKLTKDIPLSSDVDLKQLAQNTINYSGADLTKLCKEAILDAMTCQGLDIERIKYEYFEKARLKNKPSFSESQLDSYQNIML